MLVERQAIKGNDTDIGHTGKIALEHVEVGRIERCGIGSFYFDASIRKGPSRESVSLKGSHVHLERDCSLNPFDNHVIRSCFCGSRRGLSHRRICEWQMRDLEVLRLLHSKLLAQLVLLELELNLHGAIHGLDLDGFAVRVLRKEGDVVEQSVVEGVGLLLTGILVQGLHVGVVAIALGLRRNGRDLKLSVIGNGICLLEGRGHLNGRILIRVGALRGNLGRVCHIGGIRLGYYFRSLLLGNGLVVSSCLPIGNRLLVRGFLVSHSLTLRLHLLDNGLELVHLLGKRIDWR